MKVFIEPGKNFTEETRYVFRTLAHPNNISVEFVTNPGDSEFNVDVSESFFNEIKAGNFDHRNFFKDDCLIRNQKGEPDYLSTIFYMINSLQEYNATDVDEIGRFK